MIVIVEEHSFMKLFVKLCSYNNIVAILAEFSLKLEIC